MGRVTEVSLQQSAALKSFGLLSHESSFPEKVAVRYAVRVCCAEKMVNLVDSVLEFLLTGGRYTERLEGELGVVRPVACVTGEFRQQRELGGV